ncbi:MAG: NADH-quinone oxidoreductase subunit J [Acidimicrobiia bacterium]|nr:NADH-quinone oxidoreductase subunit J [Acidimicrobiia bacterium]
MSFGDWISDARNWWYLALAVPMLVAAFRVVTSRNVVHSVLYLVGALAASAGLFLLLGAEFVAWTVVLVYIGAVVVLFLMGIMITRAPLGTESDLDHTGAPKLVAAIVAGLLFLLTAGAMLDAFADDVVEPTRVTTDEIGQLLFSRYVIPFEVVSFVLLAALIGGIVLARRDPDEPEPGTGAAAAMEESVQ